MEKQHSTGLKRPLQGVNTDCSKKEHKDCSLSEISDEDLETLKCSKCDGYLSCSSVKIKEENDNICGRCSSMTNMRGYIRNIVYETLAKNKLFPCNNQIRGCTEKILFNKVQVHKEYCNYRAYQCPEKTCFEKNLTKDEMVQHYHNRHCNSIFENYAILNFELTRDDEFSALINAFDNLFVACIKTFYKKYLLSLCVRSIGSPELLKDYHYNIEIFNSSCSNTSLKEDGKKLLPYKNDFLEKDTAQNIYLRSIFKKCGTSIKLKISIGKTILKEIKLTADQIPVTASTSRMNVETNKAMLQSKKIEELKRLPSTSGMQDSDKGSKLTNQMQFDPILTKCKNKECFHFYNRQNLQKHEKYFCPYNRKCFACDNNTHAQFKSHLQEMHSRHMIESSSIKMIPKVNDWWMTTIDKTIYYCKIVEKENNLYIQIISNQDKNALDKFVLQVNNYYMSPDKVNDNSLVDWEINLDICKKLDRNKNIFLKFIGIKKE